MIYRKLGNTGLEFSSLGFGCMRLPFTDGDVRNIDVEKVREMVHYDIDNGVNYFDLALPYHEGMAEVVIGDILKEDNLRDKIYIGSKLPVWKVKSYEDCEEVFENQLKKLKTDYFDIYLLHNMDYAHWELAKKYRVFDLFDKKIKEGKIKHIGFSFHGNVPLLKEIIDYYKWEFCLIQHNYMDTDYQAGTEGLEYAYSKGLGVMIMEPLKGGQLAKKSPEPIQNIWDKCNSERTAAQWGLAYLFNKKEVSCVLSGMNSMEMLKENIETANMFPIGSLSDEEVSLYGEVKKEFEKLIKIPCTRCQYCLPCPFDVDIPSNIDSYNMGFMYNTIEHAKNFYNRAFFDPKRSTNCTSCGACLPKCPQHLNIPEIMKRISDEWAIKK